MIHDAQVVRIGIHIVQYYTILYSARRDGQLSLIHPTNMSRFVEGLKQPLSILLHPLPPPPAEEESGPSFRNIHLRKPSLYHTLIRVIVKTLYTYISLNTSSYCGPTDG